VKLVISLGGAACEEDLHRVLLLVKSLTSGLSSKCVLLDSEKEEDGRREEWKGTNELRIIGFGDDDLNKTTRVVDGKKEGSMPHF